MNFNRKITRRIFVAILIISGLFVGQFLLDLEIDTGLYTTLDLTRRTTAKLYLDATIKPYGKEKSEFSISGITYFESNELEEEPIILYTNSAKNAASKAMFTVEAKDDLTTEVVVASGEVTLSYHPKNYPNKRTLIKIMAGQKGIIKAKGIVQLTNDNPFYMAWVNLDLVFNHTRLSEVAYVLRKVYGYEIVFSDPSQKDCRVSQHYVKKRTEKIIAAIAKDLGLTYQIEEKIITLKGSCR